MAEHRENDKHNMPEAIPIRDQFRPVINAHYSGIVRGTINANNFELKPALINMVQQNQFAGTATADPHVYLRTFLEITDTGPSKRMASIASLGKYHDMAGVGDKISDTDTVDAAADGTIFAKSPAQAYDLLDQMTINSYQWPSKRSRIKNTAGVYAVDPITSLTAQVSTLTT
ncbi:uncharacterized protein LOC142519632 [Primulina tabacum]|uniref:uncharacterized protein LOC142519632 n=1 Tax=Primulina tabacum TaxID=48773 RepID=UPI003F5AA85A